MSHGQDQEALYELLDLLEIGENDSFEAKLARGGIPRSVWPTISAFANTSGGTVVLGLEESQNGWKVQGISDPAAMIKEFHSLFRNTQKISTEVVKPDDISVEKVDENQIVVIRVAPAARRHRPVHLEGRTDQSYVRRGDGDHRCTQDEIARMFREATQHPDDVEVLPFLGVEHLDVESIRRFRIRCRTANPELPFNGMEDSQFLERLGIYRHDLESDKKGLTRAGVLLLGTEMAIREVRPSHQLDYRYRTQDQSASVRWSDRVVWNGNLFDFYDTVSVRLLRSLPTPFQLHGDQRIDEPSGRTAIRESLVNMLVHADYVEGATSVVDHSAEGIVMRNPGSSRVPKTELVLGGRSEERNPTLARLFRQAGLAEQAGSGITKILDDWKHLRYRVPEFRSDDVRYEFSVDLKFVHLFASPDREWLQKLEHPLTEAQELAMVLALHGGVDNLTLRSTSGIHAADATGILRGLRDAGLLMMLGERR